jgi:glutamate decarboxylase
MFNFLNLGFDGYRKIGQSDLANARMLSRALEGTKYYTVRVLCSLLPSSHPRLSFLAPPQCVSNVHLPLAGPEAGQAGTSSLGSAISKTIRQYDADDAEFYQKGLPVVAFKISDGFKKKYPHVQQMWIQNLLRARKWIVPNYNLPPNEDKTEILRIVGKQT